MALRRQADNPDAIRGLVGALAAQGRGDEALAIREPAERRTAGEGGRHQPSARRSAGRAGARGRSARRSRQRAQSLRRRAAEQSRRSVAAARPRAHLRAPGRGGERAQHDGRPARGPSRHDRRALRERVAVGGNAGLGGGSRATRTDSGRAAHRRDDRACSIGCGCISRPTSRRGMARAGQTQQALATLQAAEPVAARQPRTDRRDGVGVSAGGRPEPRAVARARRDGRGAQRHRLAAAIRGHSVRRRSRKPNSAGDAPARVDAA